MRKENTSHLTVPSSSIIFEDSTVIYWPVPATEMVTNSSENALLDWWGMTSFFQSNMDSWISFVFCILALWPPWLTNTDPYLGDSLLRSYHFRRIMYMYYMPVYVCIYCIYFNIIMYTLTYVMQRLLKKLIVVQVLVGFINPCILHSLLNTVSGMKVIAKSAVSLI